MKKRISALLLTAVMLAALIPFSAISASALAPASAERNYVSGEIVEYGSYPQSQVEDAAVISALDTAAASLTWRNMGEYATETDNDSQAYFMMTDINYDGEMYRGVRILRYRNYPGIQDTDYQRIYGFECNTTYWFRYEPLKWRILMPEIGYAVCETIIDAKRCPYVTGSENGMEYADSEVRQWLCGEFADVAFTQEEYDALGSLNLENKYDDCVCTAHNNELSYDSAEEVFAKDTDDRVFLLAYKDARSWLFTGASDEIYEECGAYAQASDYVKALGLENNLLHAMNSEPKYDEELSKYVNTSDSFSWMLRSGNKLKINFGFGSSEVRENTRIVTGIFSRTCVVDSSTNGLVCDYEGVRPAICLKKFPQHQHYISEWERYTLPTASSNGCDVKRCIICRQITETRPTYLLSFDTQGGYLRALNSPSFVIAYGEAYSSVISGSLVPSRAYSSFDGWYDGSTLIDLANGTYGFNESKTLVAHWTASPYSGSCGNSLVWAVDITNHKLTITGTGAMYNYSMNNLPPWIEYVPYIETLEIEDGVTEIGDFAFVGMYDLYEMTVPLSVMSIGNNVLDVYREGMTMYCYRNTCADQFASSLGISCSYLDKAPEDSEVSVENYTLTITNAQFITAVRIAPGVWTTSSEIKNAQGVLNLSASVIAANRDENGNFCYELADGGIYSVWYKFSDGTQLIASGIDATHMTQNVVTNGVTVTVNNLYGVKDFFISRGHYTTYRQVKNADGCLGILSSRIGRSHSYTHAAAIGEPGEYTLYIRYNDANREDEIIYFTCEVTYPTVEVYGRWITVGNLDGIKVVRVAPGTFTGSKDVKNAEGCRNFNVREIAKLANADGSLTVLNNATAEGTQYTVAIEYTNLYTEIHNITVKQKVPVYEVNGSSVTFTGLDGLSLFRYAPGAFKTATGIKNAEGSQFIRPADVQNETVTLTGLSGKYTFLIQYIENSSNIITVDFGNR